MKQPRTTDQQSHLWVKDIKEENQVRGLYLAKWKKMGLTRNGAPFLRITLADRSGEIESRMWDKAEDFSSVFNEGDIIDVEGYAGSYRNQIQVTLSSLKVSNDCAEPNLLLETTTKDVAEMMGSLKKILKEIRNSHLNALLDRFLSDQQFISLFKEAPAAKNFHHNYFGGLLEHTLSVCQMAESVALHYPELDRDLLLAGAFLHDIGKVRELKIDHRIDYSDEGRLLGHLILGVSMLDEKGNGLKKFPQALFLRLKHLILSHHGQYEFGSPKRPKFLEAFALHLIDDLDAKMKGLSSFMEKDHREGSWTDFNRLFERFLLKGGIPMVEEETDSDLPRNDGQKMLFSP
jgi:3'-5' exoribonuclease